MLMKILHIIAFFAFILSILGLPLFMLVSSMKAKAIIAIIGGVSFAFWLAIGMINDSRTNKYV